MPPDPARLLVLAPNWLGDVVMALPAMADLRRRFESAHVSVAARRSLVDLFESVPGVEGRVALDGHGVSGHRHDVAALRAGAFDAALLLPNSFHAALLTWRAGIRERWGYARDARGALLTRGIYRPHAGRAHQSAYYQHLTTELGCPAGPAQPALRLSDATRAAGDRVLRASGWTGERLVGLAPGAAYGSAKRWPPARAGELAARLVRDYGVRPVVVGAADDQDTAREVDAAAERAGSPVGTVINLAGRTTLRQLLGVLARCAAFASNDSGAMHLAAALDVPVTAIFGPTREWATRPLAGPAGVPPAVVTADVFCRPCMLRTCPIDHRCMTRITVDRVAEAVGAQLQKGVRHA